MPHVTFGAHLLIPPSMAAAGSGGRAAAAAALICKKCDRRLVRSAMTVRRPALERLYCERCCQEQPADARTWAF